MPILNQFSPNKKSATPEGITDFLIGVTGFEPAASWSRTKHSTGLSHTPITEILYHNSLPLSIVAVKIFAPSPRLKKKQSHLTMTLVFYAPDRNHHSAE